MVRGSTSNFPEVNRCAGMCSTTRNARGSGVSGEQAGEHVNRDSHDHMFVDRLDPDRRAGRAPVAMPAPLVPQMNAYQPIWSSNAPSRRLRANLRDPQRLVGGRGIADDLAVVEQEHPDRDALRGAGITTPSPPLLQLPGWNRMIASSPATPGAGTPKLAAA